MLGVKLHDFYRETLDSQVESDVPSSEKRFYQNMIPHV